MAGPCKPGKEKNANGRCVKIRTCEDPNKEKNANGRCVKKCKSFQHRSQKTGVCLPREKSTAKAKAKSISKSVKKLPKRFTSAELSYIARELKYVKNPGTRKMHLSTTERVETPGKKFQSAELDAAMKNLKHVATSKRGSRKPKHNKLRGKLIARKRNLKHVSQRGTRKRHTSKTIETPGFWDNFKY
jgi:hypothetical protein